MSNDIRVFKCIRPGCKGETSFNMQEAAKNSGNYAIQCPLCTKHWRLAVEGSSCCRTFVRFSSIESTGKAIVKVKSYPKTKTR